MKFKNVTIPVEELLSADEFEQFNLAASELYDKSDQALKAIEANYMMTLKILDQQKETNDIDGKEHQLKKNKAIDLYNTMTQLTKASYFAQILSSVYEICSQKAEQLQKAFAGVKSGEPESVS